MTTYMHSLFKEFPSTHMHGPLELQFAVIIQPVHALGLSAAAYLQAQRQGF